MTLADYDRIEKARNSYNREKLANIVRVRLYQEQHLTGVEIAKKMGRKASYIQKCGFHANHIIGPLSRQCPVCGMTFQRHGKAEYCSDRCYLVGVKKMLRYRPNPRGSHWTPEMVERWGKVMSDPQAWLRLRKLMIGAYV